MAASHPFMAACSKEGRNGMFRRYLSKRGEITVDMAKGVWEIANKVNKRPMCMNGYCIPVEVFTDELTDLQA